MFLDLTGESVALLTLVALLAGVIDAIVGGGGLVQLPFLLAVLPGFGTATPLGVNKAVSALGNLSSAAVYWRRNPGTRVDVRLLAWSGTVAVAGAVAGALVAASLSVQTLRPVVIAVLVAVLWLVVSGRLARTAQAGPAPAPGRRTRLPLTAASGAIGLYDGVVGPATGSFLLLAHQRVLRRSLVDSLGTAKAIQCCMNLGGAAVLLSAGPTSWPLIALLGLANTAGSALGARLTLRHGDALVRTVLVLAVLATVGKLAHDQWS
ncbi:TSUP family transporter [Streptomyces sp. MRC013]|uniref:sulfite exporter TauE/SafE family protein n=1 Tax=Streptomyces sp. MRC013 TaxID=2898276 RepID=UPI0020263EF2|nr:TSUP family transporter [Streptomyces sp. MRC013]URM92831.1 TSUP family transporter [Streptomyces sp. MRC013]